MTWRKTDIVCAGCGKTPSEIEEYITYAKVEGITPEEYVVRKEGTYNPTNGRFWCTDCYIRVGMPLGKAR